MSWWGKILGGTFGFMLGGPLGALMGASFGHNFDRGLGRVASGQFESGDQERVQAAFFTAVFSIMGHLAKADGQVTRDEIQMARDVMTRMNLNEQMRTTAINLFNEGRQAEFPFDEVISQFRQECHRRKHLMQMFMEILLHAAYADGHVHPQERNLLNRIREHLGFTTLEFQHLEALVRNASHFGAGTGGGAQVPPAQVLKEAYEILGVTRTNTDAEVKKAYRRLMNQHHPDKLVSKGLPEEMIKLATEKTQQIKQAYETIKASRK